MAKLYAYRPNGSVVEIMLDCSQQTRLSLAIGSYTGIEAKPKNFFSYTLNIPIKENSQALDFYLSGSEDSRGDIRSVIELKFLAFPGFLKITGVEDHFIKAQFVGGIANWTQKLPEFTRELSFGRSLFDQATVDLIQQNIDPYDGTNPIWYSLKKYNGYLNSNFVDLLDWRPDMMLKRIIEAIVQYTGVTIESNLFNTEWFRLIMEPYRGDGRLEYQAFRYEVSTAFSSGASFLFLPNNFNFTITDDPFLYGSMPDFPLPPGLDQVGVEINLVLDVTVTDFANVFLLDTNLNVFDSHSLVSGVNEITLKGEFLGPNDVVVFIDQNVDFAIGSSMEIIYETLPFDNGANILHRSVFPAEDVLLDKIQGLSELFNLVWYFDGSKIVVDPKWDATLTTGEFVPGFYRNIALSENWKELTECKRSHQRNIDQSVKRDLTFAFKEDEDNLNTIGVRQYARTVRLSASYPDGETIKQNSYYSPVQNSNIGDDYATAIPQARIPTWLAEEEGPCYDFCASLLYKAGPARMTYSRDGVSFSISPLAAMQALSIDYNPPFPFDDFNLGMADYKGVPGLVSVFHEKDIDILNRGHRAKTRLLVNASMFQPIEELFRRLKLVETDCEQGFYILEKIDLIGDNIAQIDLINVPR